MVDRWHRTLQRIAWLGVSCAPFVGACDCTTFGLDAAETTGGTDSIPGSSGTMAAPPPTDASGPETSNDVMSTTSTTIVEPTSTGHLDSSTGGTSGTTTSGTTETTGGSAPEATALQLGFSQVKRFDFSWSPAIGAEYYQLRERVGQDPEYAQIGVDIVAEAISWVMPLHLRFDAHYRLRACNTHGCTDSQPVDVDAAMTAAIGYFKASNPQYSDRFGYGMALSGDGQTLAVGAYLEDGSGTGIDDDPDELAQNSGAAYVFVRSNDEWSQQAYVKASDAAELDQFGYAVAISGDGDTLAVGANKANNSAGAAYVFVRSGSTWTQQAVLAASNAGHNDQFGGALALSADGATLVVGALREDSSTNGINTPSDNAAGDAGAAYVFTRAADDWTEQAYLKASNSDLGDLFGASVTASADGNTVVVGAYGEDSNATGINKDPNNNDAEYAGAVYVFSRANNAWTQPAYIKASNTQENDKFGVSVALAADGQTLAVGAHYEESAGIGVDADQLDNSANDSGAVYVFSRAGNEWSHQAYVKASNTDTSDLFGTSTALSASGDTLVVGAYFEKGAGVGLHADQADNAAKFAGAAYVYVRVDGEWSSRAYLKSSNNTADDQFGLSVAVSADGQTVAACAHGESGASPGVGGDQTDQSEQSAGACYLY
jgi:hypothetical protein